MITKSYLMWVGKEHYPTIKDYTDEAEKLGISKRLPNVHMARALSEPGAAVFLAHDEGLQADCAECIGKCWDCGGTGKINIKTPAEHTCSMCDGEGVRGTGGSITVDGKKRAWLDHWRCKMYDVAYRNAEHVEEDQAMCAPCGGKGRLPMGKVFGMFLPGGIEFILPQKADDDVRKAAEEKGFSIVEEKTLKGEARRGCGIRKPGGYYVVSKTTATSDDIDKANEVIVKLVGTGALKASDVKVKGTFLSFLEPVPITEKRFRGLKVWDLTAEVAESAKMIADAAA